MRQKEPACFFDFFDLFGHARASAGSLRCRPTQSRSYREQPMLIEPYAARPHIEREKSGRRSRPPLSNVVQEQSGRRHLHRLFGVRNVVSANDRHASGLAQLARGRPPAAEMIAETKWDDHAVLSCAAYNQCRPAHDLHSSAGLLLGLQKQPFDRWLITKWSTIHRQQPIFATR